MPNDLNVVFFGHSMDVSDKDIIKRIFDISQNRYVKYIVYCYDKSSQGQCIANIINIIGQDNMIKKIEDDRLIFRLIKEE